jgi:hypothetical protein
MFCFQENPGITRTEICGKGQGQKAAINCYLTCCKEGRTYKIITFRIGAPAERLTNYW